MIKKVSKKEKELYHVVKKGETLELIAQKYGVSPEEIKAWNALKSNRVKAGEKLLIRKKKEEEVRAEEGGREREDILYHKVKKGETLEKIAKKYGVSKEDLKVWNNLESEKLKVGQKLKIKGISVREEKKEKKRFKEIIYRVREGETLKDIAELFGVSEEELIKLNNLKEGKVKPGQRLLIRVSEEQKTKEDKSKEVKAKEKREEPESLKETFEKIKAEEEALRKKGLTRKDYLKLIAQYRHLYLLYPGSEIAPLSLLKTAELYHELYQQSLKKTDALEAAKRFELFLKNYPSHPLRERVVLSLLELYERELKDKEKAEELKRTWGLRITKKKEGEKRLEKKALISNETSKPEKEVKKTQELLPDLKRVLHIEPITGEDYTRIIIDLSGNFKYALNLLPEGKDKPPRLYVDLYPAKLDQGIQRVIDLEDRHLKAVRVGQFDPQTVRVVLDLRSLSDYKVFKVNEPYQLIIDLVGKEKRTLREKKEKIAGAKEVKEERKRSSKIVRKEIEKEEERVNATYINLVRQFGLGVKRIMIDPGHGGEDPGALGPNGLREKDVVLKLAHLLGKKLEERLGVEVLYTRTKDIFIPLAKRPALANSQKADLFISLHLNASPDPKAKGIEVYYLNFTTDPEAIRVAALENRVNNQGLADLQDLVKAVLANTKLNESRELAHKVQKELVRYLSKFYPDTEDRGVKYAPFLVLVGTRMPAILVEADFITNPIIAKRLTEEDYLEKLAEGIAKGIEAYIQSLKLSFNP